MNKSYYCPYRRLSFSFPKHRYLLLACSFPDHWAYCQWCRVYWALTTFARVCRTYSLAIRVCLHLADFVLETQTRQIGPEGPGGYMIQTDSGGFTNPGLKPGLHTLFIMCGSMLPLPWILGIWLWCTHLYFAFTLTTYINVIAVFPLPCLIFVNLFTHFTSQSLTEVTTEV